MPIFCKSGTLSCSYPVYRLLSMFAFCFELSISTCVALVKGMFSGPRMKISDWSISIWGADFFSFKLKAFSTNNNSPSLMSLVATIPLPLPSIFFTLIGPTNSFTSKLNLSFSFSREAFRMRQILCWPTFYACLSLHMEICSDICSLEGSFYSICNASSKLSSPVKATAFLNINLAFSGCKAREASQSASALVYSRTSSKHCDLFP
mmetsp:Transcript_9369/g.7151  ORF Transcript_9369/g.7151 Transcript_9369/m.7151 type:complete len:206 (-) Transcript_9369:937-1554(-)